jgi:hypothetical protein
MWNCEKCGEMLEDQFNSCWKCGTGKDGTPCPNSHVSDSREREGRAILGFCTLFSALGILLSMGAGFYLWTEGHPFLGMVTAFIGAMYHSGLFIVFCEVNRIIGERKTAHNNPCD